MRIFILLGLLCVSVGLFAEEYTIEELRHEDKCGSHAPYVGYKFTQEEIDALLEQWLPLHQEWIEEIEPLIVNKNAYEIYTILDSDTSKYSNDVRRINLCGADLSKLDLSNRHLPRTNFSFAFLKETNLIKANLTNSSFYKASLANSDLALINLTNTNLVKSNLIDAFLLGANLTKTSFREANLTNADLSGANLTDASFRGANLNSAQLDGADLTKVIFNRAKLIGINLDYATLFETNFHRANLSQSKFLPSFDKLPNPVTFVSILLNQKELFKDVNYYDKDIQSVSPILISLRDYYRKNGMREVERNVTNIIQVGYEKANWEQGGWASVYSVLSKILFNWTTAYGLEPFRAINILLVSILFFTLIYWFALRIDPKHNQFEIIWQSKIKTHSTRHGITQGNIEPDMRRPFRLKKYKQGWWYTTKYELKVLSIAFYISLMYAFHIGWRQYNVGTWIRKLQHRDFSLQIRKGWIRIVSGVQSLVGLYLLVIWAFTQYGRPFE